MAKGDLIALLNTDVIPNKDFLTPTLHHFKNDKVFAVSFHEKGYGWARGFFSDGFINHEMGKESKNTHDTFWVSGGSGIFRRSMWMKLGGMDEKLLSPFYWEDIDLSYRAVKRGWQLLWEPKAKVNHEHESTMRKFDQGYKRRIQERNQLIVIWKNITSPQLFKKHLTGLWKRIGKHPGYLRIVFAAFIKLKAIRKARKKEIKEGKVSDEAIFGKFKNS
jgi:GT2 family glycosyltransferase